MCVRHGEGGKHKQTERAIRTAFGLCCKAPSSRSVFAFILQQSACLRNSSKKLADAAANESVAKPNVASIADPDGASFAAGVGTWIRYVGCACWTTVARNRIKQLAGSVATPQLLEELFSEAGVANQISKRHLKVSVTGHPTVRSVAL